MVRPKWTARRWLHPNSTRIQSFFIYNTMKRGFLVYFFDLKRLFCKLQANLFIP
jgi:hypothetical protein